MRLGTDPHQFNRNALTGMQVAGASGLLMFAVYLQIALLFLAIRLGFKVLGLAWRGLRWAGRTTAGLFTARRA